jgi:pimeloyl-ACP methyl ester carboxylesterase
VLALGAVLGLGWDSSGKAIHPGVGSYAWSLEDYPELVPEEVTVESSTGAKLAGRFFPGRTEATVILLHGYGGNQDEMLPVASTLHDGGYSVFSFDQRGCGRSTGEVTFGAREQDDLESVVDYLVTREDVNEERLGALGFSMGGATALLAAARDPRIKAVVADSSWSEAKNWLRPSVKASFLHPRDRFSSLSLKLAELRGGFDLDDLRPVEVMAKLSPRPVLLVHAGADQVVPAAEGERNFEAARKPKELVLVAGAAHGDTIEPGGTTTRERIAEFFELAFDAGKVAA